MSVKQISIFIENKEGRLKKAIATLSKANIDIRTLSLADTSKYGILRLIVSDNESAIKCLEENGFIVRENEVILVEIEDKPNGLNSALEVFENNQINIEYLYAFTSNKTNKAILVMRLEDMDKGLNILKNSDVPILEKKDIERI